MRRPPLPRQIRRRASPAAALLFGVAAPAAAALLLPMAVLPPLWRSFGDAAWPALGVSLATLAGALVTIAMRALQQRDLTRAARRTALVVALLSPFGGSLIVPALLVLILPRTAQQPPAANDNAPGGWSDAAWVPVSPERARHFANLSAA